MLTFQILDGEDPYFRPLEDRSLSVGSDASATIQLSEAGVAGIHAHVEVSGETCRIRPAGEAPVLVNGTAVTEATLALGDRVELGSAVLVLGQSIKRPATAGDVLEPLSTRRREPFGDKRSKKVQWLYAAVLILGGVGAYGVYSWGAAEQASVLPYTDREVINHARKQGRFEDALARLEKVERDWAGVDAERQSRVDMHRSWVLATKNEFERLHARYMGEVLNETEREQVNQLKQLRAQGNKAEKEAAVILMSRLRDFRIEAEAAALARRGPIERTTPAKPETPERVVTGMGNENLAKPEWLDERLAEIRTYLKAKNYVHAIELSKVTLPDVPVKFADELLELMADVRRACRDEMHTLVNRAYAMRKQGQLSAGVALLKREAMRFPGQGNLSYLYRELDQLAAELGVAGPATPHVDLAKYERPKPVAEPDPVAKKADPDPAPGAVASPERPTGKLDKRLISSVLEAVEAAERAGDLAKAVGLLQGAIAKNSTYQPRLARYLEEIRADIALIQGLATAVRSNAAAVTGKPVRLLGGERGSLAQLSGDQLHVKVGSGDPQVIGWMGVDLGSAEELAETAAVPASARLGIASLGYRQGKPKAAEAFLVRLLRRDTGLFDAASKIISRGRGEYVDAQGYTLVAGKFVAQRFVKVQKEAKALARKIARFGGMTAAERDAALVKLREAGSESTDDALVLALKEQLEALADKLGRSNLPKSLAKLSAKREALDQARKHARDLIYDTRKYFYPYKPPAVSGAKHAEYNRVQKEVDLRVDALRKIWMDKLQVPIAASLKKDIDLLLWTENQLGLMGEVSDRVLAHIDWVHMIPPVAVLSVRNFCRTAEERAALVHAMQIEELNEELAESLNDGESTLVEITNSYRAMFGHRPLAIDLKLHKAANGHGEEMSRLGYFSHTSPTSERRTPFRRMRLAGYQHGVSENIALGGSAEGAHARWCRSSGHHRNLLNPSHTEVGMGNHGKYWVQNFGRGTGYTSHEIFR